MKFKRYNLLTIIKNDFLLYGKIHLILFIAIVLSANFVIITVYKTRLLISQEEKELILKKKKMLNGEI